MERGGWQATVHRVANSWTQLQQLSTTLKYTACSTEFEHTASNLCAVLSHLCLVFATRLSHHSIHRYQAVLGAHVVLAFSTKELTRREET